MECLVRVEYDMYIQVEHILDKAGNTLWWNFDRVTLFHCADITQATMKTACLAAIIGSAAAFAPAPTVKTTTAIRAFEDELGAQAPLGFFDPFGLLNGDCTQERFDRLRYVEIKHGRISQLAFLGQVVTRGGLHLPGNIDYSGDSFDSFPNGVAALVGPNSIPTAGLVQLIAFIGFLEIAVMRDIPGMGNEHVGDFRNGYIDFGWDDFDEETKLSKRAIELNNGRAAMMGILGLMVHEEIVPLGYDADLPIIGHLV
jgi:hypothetical protein